MSQERPVRLSLAFALILCVVGAVVLLFFAVSTTTTTIPPAGSGSAAQGGLSSRAMTASESAAVSGATLPALSPERIKEIQAADRDLLGDQILARKDDPGFEMLAELMPGMTKSREAVGVKHHPHDIGVAPDGTLELADDVDAKGSPVAFFEVGSPAVRFGSAPGACVKSLYDRYLPIVRAHWEHEGVLYTQTVFGWSEGLSPDADLWAYVELEAQNMRTRTVRTRARLRVEPAAAVNPSREWKLVLKGGAAQKIRIGIPFAVGTVAVSEPAPADYERAFGDVVAFWRTDLGAGLRIDVPEPRVNAAARAGWPTPRSTWIKRTVCSSRTTARDSTSRSTATAPPSTRTPWIFGDGPTRPPGSSSRCSRSRRPTASSPRTSAHPIPVRCSLPSGSTTS
jgi:hypothetical protein